MLDFFFQLKTFFFVYLSFSIGSKLQKVPVNKMVRTDSSDPAGRLHAYVQSKPHTSVASGPNLSAVRYDCSLIGCYLFWVLQKCFSNVFENLLGISWQPTFLREVIVLLIFINKFLCTPSKQVDLCGLVGYTQLLLKACAKKRGVGRELSCWKLQII